MKIVPYIISIFITILVVFIYSLINNNFGTSLHYFNIFLILPIGGIIIGALISYVFFKTKELLKCKIFELDYLLIITLSILAFFYIDYNFYSSFLIDGIEKINYLEYIKYSHQEAELIISKKFVINVTSFNVGSKILITLTILQIIGTYLGSMLTASLFERK